MSVGQSKICIKIQARHTAALFFIYFSECRAFCNADGSQLALQKQRELDMKST